MAIGPKFAEQAVFSRQLFVERVEKLHQQRLEEVGALKADAKHLADLLHDALHARYGSSSRPALLRTNPRVARVQRGRRALSMSRYW